MNKPVSSSKYFLKYGLDRDPFPTNTIDENIYLTPEINRRLKQIKQHITDSHKLLLVASAGGAGKSLLARKIVVLKNPDWCISLINADADMQADTLANAIVQQLLAEKNENVSQAISVLHKYLEQSYRDNTLPLILIDDADKLSIDTLQFVMQLADLRYNDTFFKVVIFADESINESFERTGLKELSEGIVDIFSMPCFSREQTRAYLYFRFSSCTKDVDLPYTDEDIEYLYKASAGLPGGINLLARQLMQQSPENKKPDGHFGTMTIICFLLLLTLSIYLYYENRSLKTHQVSLAPELRSEILEIQDRRKRPGLEKKSKSVKERNINEQEQILNHDDFLSLKLSDVLRINTEDQSGSP